MKKLTARQEEVALIFAKFSKQKGTYPSHSDLKKLGLSRAVVREHFGDMDELRETSRTAFPKHFEDLVDPDNFSAAKFQELKDHVKKYKRFFVSCLVPGGTVDEDCMESVDVWCKTKKGTALFIPANYGLLELQADFVEARNIVFRDLKLNSNLWLSTIKIDPKQMDPLQNLDQIGQREGTMIVGSPKQRMRPVANSNMKLPHIIQATGAITKPRYVTKVAFGRSSERRDYLAKRQHVMGGIIIEVVDDKFYHFRQVQFDKDGSFIDAFERFDSDGVTKVEAEAIVQGDYHDGETDEQADAVADELCQIGKPKYRVFHDFINGHSISHHDRDQQVTQAIKASHHHLSLATELHNAKLTLARKLRTAGNTKFVMVRSNHDEFLHRYLQKGDFDDHNRLMSVELQLAYMKGIDPLKHAMDMMKLKDNGKIIWLDRDQDFKITPKKIEIGCHGDLGANGKRNPGSTGMLKAYGDCVYGHCHYGEINHGAWSVGTTSRMDVAYKRGASSWTHTHMVIYPNGTRQLINAINGKWRIV